MRNHPATRYAKGRQVTVTGRYSLSRGLDALEARVIRVEAMTEVVTAVRADVATIAEGVDPALAGHVAELADTVETTACCWPGYNASSIGPTNALVPPDASVSAGARVASELVRPRVPIVSACCPPSSADRAPTGSWSCDIGAAHAFQD
jgi:hypothetical protein